MDNKIALFPGTFDPFTLGHHDIVIRGLKIFDFEGIYDQRFPKLNKGWIGFSNFKKGFG